MSQGACKYKVDPAPIFLFTYVAGSFLCSALVVLLALFDPSFRQAKLPVVLETIGYVLVFFGPPYAALCALILTHYFRYDVTADGVCGQNWMGRTVLVNWAEVAAARPIHVANLEFIRLVSADGARVWLPMFVHPASPAESSAFAWIAPHHPASAGRPRVAASTGA